MKSGAEKFINKLENELNKLDLPRYHLITSKQNIQNLNSKLLKIGRLDGVAYYRFTLRKFCKFSIFMERIRFIYPNKLLIMNFII